MKKFPTKAVIKKLAKLDEYYYPIHRCSLFVLPDGKIVGTLDLFDHRNMLELAGSGKLSDQDFFNFMVDAGLVRLVVNDLKILHVNVLTSITQAQKKHYRDLACVTSIII